MRRRSFFFGERSTMHSRRRQAADTARTLGKKRSLNPVVVEGHKLAHSWWAQAWNANLERYADYSNRIGRGRSYLRNGLVLDLQIQTGHVTALVAGSHPNPYEVGLTIRPLGKRAQQALVRKTADSIASVEALLDGEFPESMRELLFGADNGLFPAPREMKFTCTCPDWAQMCKHVAATLLGVGCRLDATPEVFFTLRGMEPASLARSAARHESVRLLANRAGGSRRAIPDADLEALFGIAMQTERTKARAGSVRGSARSRKL